MEKRVSLIVSAIICFLGVSLAAQDFEGLIARGDSLADQWDYRGAAIAYSKALAIDSASYEAQWKTGDMYTELADALDEDKKDQKERYFEEAARHCEKAVELNPDGWEGHLKLSVVYGRLGLFRGGKEKVKLGQKVRTEAEKALELNPSTDIAMHVLGRWHQNIADLSGLLKFFAKTFFGEELKGSFEESAEWFKKAIEINPTHIEHYYQLAVTYEMMGKEEKMKEPLEKVLSLEAVKQGDEELKEKAKQMLKDLD